MELKLLLADHMQALQLVPEVGEDLSSGAALTLRLASQPQVG